MSAPPSLQGHVCGMRSWLHANLINLKKQQRVTRGKLQRLNEAFTVLYIMKKDTQHL